MQVMNAKQLTSENVRLKAGVYGKAGTGKTTLGATFPKPLFLDLDGGLLSIRGQDIPYIDLTSGTNPTWPAIMDALDEGKKDVYESVIADSLSGVAHLAMIHVQTLNRTLGKKPGFDDWSMFANSIRSFVERLISTKKHVLLICHEALDKEEGTGRTWILPAIQGQMKTKITDFFDEFYHAEVDEIPGKPSKYQLLARPTGIYTAKSRLMKKGTTENYLEPSFQTLITLAKESK